MTRDTLLTGLTVLNLVLLAAIGIGQMQPAAAQGAPGILRGSGLEIVDAAGRLRASLTIQPAAEGASETVLRRLINADGQPSAKISASLTGSGLSFVGGDDASYIVLGADGPEAELRLVEGERQQVLVP